MERRIVAVRYRVKDFYKHAKIPSQDSIESWCCRSGHLYTPLNPLFCAVCGARLHNTVMFEVTLPLEFIVRICETFANESGGHRFQRVPATENSDRTKTSTITIAVLPDVEEEKEGSRMDNENETS